MKNVSAMIPIHPSLYISCKESASPPLKSASDHNTATAVGSGKPSVTSLCEL